MIDQYFGIKELSQACLRARDYMTFGKRKIEPGEPVLYFKHVNLSTLTQNSGVTMARGGWSNMPRVIWEDRSEVNFTLSEGVMSSLSMGILLSADVGEQHTSQPLYAPMQEGPMELDNRHRIYLKHWPVANAINKSFIFQFDRDAIQKKIYGKRITGIQDPFSNNDLPCLELYEDKELTEPADIDKKYLIDYYYAYEGESLEYSIRKERFNGLFTLEGKFYSKDENEGLSYTNLLRMPKVRVVSDINLRLGEGANPTVAVFDIIGVPEKTTTSNSLIVDIIRLDRDIDGEI